MYENILVPVDGSDGAARILHHAGELAHWADATIQLLFVADTTRDSLARVEGNIVDALAQEGESVVEDAGKTLDSLGVDYETDVVQGNPARTIVDYAERYDYDVIVMSTHGREGLSRHLLGSVTEKVVRLSAVPVLTVRMRADERLTFPYESVLVPTDGSDGAMTAARHGLAFAASLGATVHVLSAVDTSGIGARVLAGLSDDDRTKRAKDAVDAVVAEAETHGIGDVVTHVEQTAPDEAIRECIDANDVSAVVMGTTGWSGTGRVLLGSVAEKTVRSAPVPVLTVADKTTDM
ncbi:universal stress protein [Haloferacaceae archaeon DSL9]